MLNIHVLSGSTRKSSSVAFICDDHSIGLLHNNNNNNKIILFAFHLAILVIENIQNIQI